MQKIYLIKEGDIQNIYALVKDYELYYFIANPWHKKANLGDRIKEEFDNDILVIFYDINKALKHLETYEWEVLPL